MAPIGTADYMDRLSELEKALEGIEADREEENNGDDHDHDIEYEEAQEKLQSILRDICTIVREAEEHGGSNLEVVITRADDLIRQGVNLAYSSSDGMFDERLFEFLPSFAHSATSPLVQDGKSTPSLCTCIFLSIIKCADVFCLNFSARSYRGLFSVNKEIRLA